MDEVCVVLEQKEGELIDAAGEIIAHGKALADKLEQKLCAVVMGSELGAMPERLNSTGIDELYLIEAPALQRYLPELYTQALAKFVQEHVPTIVILGATSNGSDLASRVASSLKVGLVSECIGFGINQDGSLLMEKLTYEGKVLTTLSFNPPDARGQIATVKLGTAEVVEGSRADIAEVIRLTPELAEDKVSIKLVDSFRVDPLTLPVDESEVVVAGGRGLGSLENVKILEEMARALGGTLGASRIAVDNQWLPRERQVGQSGKTVEPKLYVACGISGASHHVLGMKDSQFVVAINTDPDAPIFKVSDVGIVGDLVEVLPAITTQINEQGRSKGEK